MERSLPRRPMAPTRSGASRTITMAALSVTMATPLLRFRMTVVGRCFQAPGTARWAHRRATLALELASIRSSLSWLLRPLLLLLHLQGRHACDIIRTAGA